MIITLYLTNQFVKTRTTSGALYSKQKEMINTHHIKNNNNKSSYTTLTLLEFLWSNLEAQTQNDNNKSI